MHTLWIFEFVNKTFCHNILLIIWKLFDELTGHGYDGDDNNKDEDDNVYKYQRCERWTDKFMRFTTDRNQNIYQIFDGAKLSILDDLTALKRINSCKNVLK